jgi:isopropylmalate/homocitrate/citramalate synthase
MLVISDENVRAIKRLTSINLKAEIVAFCRALRKDVDVAYDSGANRIIVEHAVNPYVNKFVYNSSAEEVISKVVECILYAKDKNMRVTFMGWDTTQHDLI